MGTAYATISDMPSTTPVRESPQPQSDSRPTGLDTVRASMKGKDGQEITITDRQIVDQIRRLRKEAEERMMEIMNTMLLCYDQYRNHKNFDDKEAWQSRITIAKANAAVKHATANILKLLTQSSQPITVEDSTHIKDFFVPFVEKGVLKVWEVAVMREVLRDALEGGFACGLGCIKESHCYQPRNYTSIGEEDGMTVIQGVSQLEGKTRFHSIDPWRIKYGPNTRWDFIDWICEDHLVDVCDLREMGGFENLEKMENEDFSGDEQKDRDRRRKDIGEPTEHVRKKTRMWEFWGDLIDENSQQVIAKNVHVFVGNESHILKYSPNPFWDKKKPYRLFSPMNVAWRFPGQGILETTLALKDAIDEIAQMQVDYLKFSLLPQYEVDMGTLQNPEDISTGVEPGKIFRKKMGTAGVPAFRQLETHPLTGDSFNALLAFGKEHQRGTFITEQTQGLLDSKGETTATEVQQTTLNTTLMLSDISLHIEDTLLAPLAKDTWELMFQFMDATSNPSWETIIGPSGRVIDQLPVQTRIAIIQGDYHFSSRGLSRSIERQAELQKLIQWMQIVGQFPMFQALMNMPEAFRRIWEDFHFPDPQALLSPQAQQIMQQLTVGIIMQNNPAAQQMMQARAQMAQQAQQASLQAGQSQVEHGQAIDQANVGAGNDMMLEVLSAALNQKSQTQGEKK